MNFRSNFRQWLEAFINTDTRRFEIQTNDMGPNPSTPAPLRQGLISGKLENSKPIDWIHFKLWISNSHKAIAF